MFIGYARVSTQDQDAAAQIAALKTSGRELISPGGRMMMQIVGSFAEFERAMLRERTRSGLDAARTQGRVGGRHPKLKAHQQQEIVHLINFGQKTAADAARLFNLNSAVERIFAS